MSAPGQMQMDSIDESKANLFLRTGGSNPKMYSGDVRHPTVSQSLTFTGVDTSNVSKYAYPAFVFRVFFQEAFKPISGFHAGGLPACKFMR